MPESCPEIECHATMHEHFIKKSYVGTGEEPVYDEYVSQGYWCPRCRKWFDWKKVQTLIEKR